MGLVSEESFTVLMTYHLEFILPKLFLLRLVQERKVADMVHKYVS